MTLSELVDWASNKTRFTNINDYIEFCKEYLAYIFDGLQAVIISRNKTHYHFYQYKEDGTYNITRPINSNLMYSIDNFETACDNFFYSMPHIRELNNEHEIRSG